MNSANREQLLAEYARYNRRPLQMKINNEAVIIPVEYALSGSIEDIQKKFLTDYFDEQKKECERYKRAGVAPRMIEFNGAKYVVPYQLRDSDRKDTDIVGLVLRKAKAKYNRAISLTRKMARAYPERGYTVEVAGDHVANLRAGYNRYLIETGLDKTKAAMVKAAEMILEGGRLVKGEISSFTPQELQRAARKAAVGLLIGGSALLGTYGTFKLAEKIRKPESKENIWQSQAEADAMGVRLTVDDMTLVPVAMDEFSRTKAEKDRLFKKYMREIFESEGGYADKKIDQPTNMGIIQPTLNAYTERFPEEAKRLKFPQNVKGLKKNQAMEIYHQLYFNQYKIGDYRNESIGMLIFDLYVNHEPKTVKSFIDQALKKARSHGAEVKLPSTSGERVAVINSLAMLPEAESAFYEQILKERMAHMYEKTTAKAGKKSRFAKGLKNRAEKYAKRYVSTGRQEKNNPNYMRLASVRQK
ncbi:MAG: hypothetical protein OSJ76_06025 [Alphaproteobacteria bacterium]|nr:hypothetical protein [Alphaproteobacteria bacterium]